MLIRGLILSVYMTGIVLINENTHLGIPLKLIMWLVGFMIFVSYIKSVLRLTREEG